MPGVYISDLLVNWRPTDFPREKKTKHPWPEVGKKPNQKQAGNYVVLVQASSAFMCVDWYIFISLDSYSLASSSIPKRLYPREKSQGKSPVCLECSNLDSGGIVEWELDL